MAERLHPISAQEDSDRPLSDLELAWNRYAELDRELMNELIKNGSVSPETSTEARYAYKDYLLGRIGACPRPESFLRSEVAVRITSSISRLFGKTP